MAVYTEAEVKELELALTPRKVQAVLLLVEREFNNSKETYAEIAEKIGITRQTLDVWRKEQAFRELVCAYSEQYLIKYRLQADKMLQTLIGEGNVRALELYYRLQGAL